MLTVILLCTVGNHFYEMDNNNLSTVIEGKRNWNERSLERNLTGYINQMVVIGSDRNTSTVVLSNGETIKVDTPLPIGSVWSDVLLKDNKIIRKDFVGNTERKTCLSNLSRHTGRSGVYWGDELVIDSYGNPTGGVAVYACNR